MVDITMALNCASTFIDWTVRMTELSSNLHQISTQCILNQKQAQLSFTANLHYVSIFSHSLTLKINGKKPQYQPKNIINGINSLGNANSKQIRHEYANKHFHHNKMVCWWCLCVCFVCVDIWICVCLRCVCLCVCDAVTLSMRNHHIE